MSFVTGLIHAHPTLFGLALLAFLFVCVFSLCVIEETK